MKLLSDVFFLTSYAIKPNKASSFTPMEMFHCWKMERVNQSVGVTQLLKTVNTESIKIGVITLNTTEHQNNVSVEYSGVTFNDKWLCKVNRISPQ